MRVAINGTGVAGPTLAYWLHRFGHKPVLFEKAPALRTGGYVIDFWGLGFNLAERMGLLPALLERCYKMERLSMVGADGREVAGLDVTRIRKQLDGRFISLARANIWRLFSSSPAKGYPLISGCPHAVTQDGQGAIATLSDGRRERFDPSSGQTGCTRIYERS